jgi:hypothetical protein
VVALQEITVGYRAFCCYMSLPRRNKAREFCTGKGKKVMSGPARTSGARDWTPVESTLTLQCLDATDPAYAGPNLLDIAPNGKSAPN